MVATLLGALALVVATATPAAADTIGAGDASAFGGTISAGGQEVAPPTPTASATLPGDASDTTVDIPAEPVAVSGTLNADAAVHAASDLDSALDVATQEVAGPYNAVATGSIEEADVLVDVVGEGVSLLSADAIRAEAVGVCVGGAVQYSATSEIINLDVGGQDIPLNAPLEQILDAVGDVLEQTTLEQVVDIERNVVTELEDGIAVDALVVTVLAVAGDPVAEVRLGHAEVSGLACGAAPECSDGVDNDDPEDELADEADPGCHTDGNADNPDSYDPTSDSELDGGENVEDDGTRDTTTAVAVQAQLPSTGGNAAATAGLAGAMAAAALGVVALRRRLG
ncbi:MAG TPA: hypothetical protein DCS55_09445 [Acidimicrobiaceae bacterium]|nr:hypothetical protein [Acidimicrobiaceae bacterium]